jgi:hypothetical protein
MEHVINIKRKASGVLWVSFPEGTRDDRGQLDSNYSLCSQYL